MSIRRIRKHGQFLMALACRSSFGAHCFLPAGVNRVRRRHRPICHRVPVLIRMSDWLDPLPGYEGERVLWPDGLARNWPEAPGDDVMVLRCASSRARNRLA